MNYLILIIILVALYYFVIDVLLVSAYEKPLHKRMDEKNRWKNNILKIEKLTFRDHELYICICSQKIFYSYVDHIKICLESKSNDFFEIKEKTGLGVCRVPFNKPAHKSAFHSFKEPFSRF